MHVNLGPLIGAIFSILMVIVAPTLAKAEITTFKVQEAFTLLPITGHIVAFSVDIPEFHGQMGGIEIIVLTDKTYPKALRGAYRFVYEDSLACVSMLADVFSNCTRVGSNRKWKVLLKLNSHVRIQQKVSFWSQRKTFTVKTLD